jgi:hypothetical protein
MTRRERALAAVAITLVAGGLLAVVLGALSKTLAVIVAAPAVAAFGAGMALVLGVSED